MLASDEQGYSLLEGNAFEAAAGLLAEDQAELADGETVDHYQVLRLLGVGGMGQVYLAEDTRLSRKVALKLLPARTTQSPSRLRRFRQEARAASALNHPNILTIHDILEVGGRHLIVTEYIDGEALRQRLEQARLSTEQALDVAIQVASALSAAHQAGIIHRDIKPENIMLRRDGLVKVLDFGLAKLVEGQDPASEMTDSAAGESAAQTGGMTTTESGLLMGTVPYMSPEQLGGQPVDAGTDIYSLGVVIYEMVTGRLPFKAEGRSALSDSILKDDPPPLSGDGIRLQGIVDQALRKQREERYLTAGELLADLKALKQTLDAKPTAATEASRARQRRALAALALVVMVIAAVIFFAFSHRPRQAFQHIKLIRLTTFGKVWGTAISPDGKHVAYFKDEGSKLSLWVKEVGSTTETLLVAADNIKAGGGITFSRDNQFIYFGATPGIQVPGSYYRIPVGGGTAVAMPNLPDRSPINFSPDGKRIAYWRNDFANGVTSILIANEDGTGERELVRRQAPNYFSSSILSWSVDSKMIACIGVFASDGYPSVVAVNVEDGTEKRLTPQRWNSIQALAWLPDMSGLIMTAADVTSLDSQLWHLAYPSGEARKITNDLNRYDIISLTADGSAVVAAQEDRQFRIWTAPVKQDGVSADGSAGFSVDMSLAREISANISNAARSGLCWTPDGRVVYSSLENGYCDLWIVNADGSNRRQLTNDPHIDNEPAVSPDSRYVVFTSQREGSEHIWIVGTDGENLWQLTHGRVERNPVFSPDGKWVYYTSWETGKATVWRIPSEGGEAEQVVEATSSTPHFSPDGHLFIFRTGSGGVSIMRTEGGPPIKTFENLRDASIIRWTPDGKALSFLAYRDGSDAIWVMPLDTGKQQKLINFKPDSMWFYEWSSDGKQLAFARGTLTRDVVLINDVK
ncbi:MAG TPA: protein kinase [Blastocatellia bacterium]|nr:protein kinase [Blastocatellia bacterium]